MAGPARAPHPTICVPHLTVGVPHLTVGVALPVPLDQTFDYAVPPALQASAEAGRRAIVPFGARRVVGVIVGPGTGDTPDGVRLRAIERIVDARPVLSAELLAVLREEAQAVLCPLGIALAAALPAGSAPRPRRRWAPTARGEEALRAGALPAAARALMEALGHGRAPRSAAERRLLHGLSRDGLVAAADDVAAPRAREARVRVASVAPGIVVEEHAAGDLARAPRQSALLRILGEGPRALPDLEARLPGAAAALRSLAARGLVQLEERLAPHDVLGTPLDGGGRVELSPEQADATAELRAAVRERRADTFLLHGVTGSGKTEVYLQAVDEALCAGRQALVLVPEITLTHQIVARLRARFGDAMAVLHSGLTPGERLEQWERLRAGATPIAVGARSALFAPLENLGVIVIDEEHDSAYKNEEGFRYHARDLAARRAAHAGCPVVLGSATPALETRFAADRGRVRRLVLPHRIVGRPLPAVQLVDLERERAAAPRGRKLILTKPLRQAMAETLAAGGQTILLLNRRGFSTKIFCFECGFAERCKHCDIALVFHAEGGRLRCHYCGYESVPPERCSGCGAPDTALLGVGTERLEEEVRTRFPTARIARLDRDTASRRGGTEKILRALRECTVDILVGTQMVAKGHDFPGVLLVGVVAADLGLHLPDFRAAERTFQLLTQVAGRAGRGHTPGRVIVQTFVPEHYAIRPVRDHDYEAFYADELAQRAALGYPPFGRLVYVLVSAKEAERASEAIERLAIIARDAGASALGTPGTPVLPGRGALELLGPAPAPIARLRDRFRFQLLLKGADESRLFRIAQSLAREAARLAAGISASVDVNPVSML
jgi:primosomal protein N' (replication factor Y)